MRPDLPLIYSRPAVPYQKTSDRLTFMIDIYYQTVIEGQRIAVELPQTETY